MHQTRRIPKQDDSFLMQLLHAQTRRKPKCLNSQVTRMMKTNLTNAQQYAIIEGKNQYHKPNQEREEMQIMITVNLYG